MVHAEVQPVKGQRRIEYDPTKPVAFGLIVLVIIVAIGTYMCLLFAGKL
jgi:hypothetical protein